MGLLFVPIALLILFVLVLLPIMGVAAVVFGVVREMPWILILLGLWILLRPHVGSRRQRRSDVSYRERRRRHQEAPSVSAAQPVVATVEAKVVPTKRELPIDVQVKVDQIKHKADMLLGYADRFPPFSHDLHLVRQTAADYLPRTLDTYLALPGTADPVVDGGGSTALMELRAQLDLLDSKLDEIAQDLQRQDLDRLLANRRFLEDRFRPVDVGTTQDAA